MLEILKEVEENLFHLLENKASKGEAHTMYIDYHKPYVSRIWFQHGEYRVYLHMIHPCDDPSEALYHPHPWQSAIKLIKGSYEMGIGHSETNETPITDCKLILSEGSSYEMIDENSWHYVSPKTDYVYSLMVTGKRNDRTMPLEPENGKVFRNLDEIEIDGIMDMFAHNRCVTSYTVDNIKQQIIKFEQK